MAKRVSGSMRARKSLSELIEGRLSCTDGRQLRIIPNAFGEEPVLKLMFRAMIRAADRWRGIKVSELERRQMRAVREDLDQEYQPLTVRSRMVAKDDSMGLVVRRCCQ